MQELCFQPIKIANHFIIHDISGHSEAVLFCLLSPRDTGGMKFDVRVWSFAFEFLLRERKVKTRSQHKPMVSHKLATLEHRP
jgi:hypothetical protein